MSRFFDEVAVGLMYDGTCYKINQSNSVSSVFPGANLGRLVGLLCLFVRWLDVMSEIKLAVGTVSVGAFSLRALVYRLNIFLFDGG